MYRPNRGGSGRLFLNLIVLGMVVGIGFFAYDNFFSGERTPQPVAAPTLASSATPSNFTVTEAVAAPPTPTPNPMTALSPGTDASLFIPSVGVNAPVITAILRDATWDVTQLGTNVGYLQGTSWVGQSGNVVLSGHVEMSDGRTGVFSTLDEIAVGDLVVITEDGEQFNYVVRDKFYVEPNDLSVVYPTTTEVLTLITCSDYNFIDNSYDTRFVVVADRV